MNLVLARQRRERREDKTKRRGIEDDERGLHEPGARTRPRAEEVLLIP